MKKSIIRITSFLLILLLCLGYVNSVFKVKYGDGIYDLKKFYELDRNSVDVLILGSSHAFEDFNTGTLWDEYGMASYILAGSIQPLWNTYYYLKEALKTQTPELIVLEGYGLSFSSEYSDYSRIIKNNYGLRWSKDKFDSLMISSPPGRKKELLLEHSQYHTRYKELSSEDYLKDMGNPMFTDWKGFACNTETKPLSHPDVSDVVERAPLMEKTEKYYRLTLELAAEKNIPIVVIISPYAEISNGEQMMYNMADNIAEEYGVKFLNCNQLDKEIGIDWSVDAADEGHLNHYGNQKFSRYIGQYLVDNFDISDRRGIKEYTSWEKQARFDRQVFLDHQLVESKELSEIAEKLKNENYWVFLSSSGTSDTADEQLAEIFDNLGVARDGRSGAWYVNDGEIIWESLTDGEESYKQTRLHDFLLDCKEGKRDIIIDNKNLTTVANGLNVVVYDTLTGKVADCIGIDADAGYAIIRTELDTSHD